MNATEFGAWLDTELGAIKARLDDNDQTNSAQNSSILIHAKRLNALESGQPEPEPDPEPEPEPEPPPVPNPDLGPLDFEATFEGGSQPLAGSGNKPVATREIAPRRGQWCMLSEVSEQKQNTFRTEGVIPGKAKNMILDRDYWFGFAVRLPADWIDPPVHQIVFQIHNALPSGQPPFAFSTADTSGRFKYLVNAGGGKTQGLGLVVFDNLERWIDCVIRYRPSTKNNGVVEGWMDGEKILSYSGVTCAVPADGTGPYAKWGCYEGKTFVNKSPVKIYHDEIRVASGPQAKYADVAPSSYN